MKVGVDYDGDEKVKTLIKLFESRFDLLLTASYYICLKILNREFMVKWFESESY